MSGREQFGSRASVIMAMAGSAIGLGNLWRFPYIVGQYGGAAFILVYMLCCLFLSLPILFSESVIGRSTHRNTFGAMATLAPGTKWKWLGLLTVVSPLILLSYYSVVGGWSIEYFFKSLTFSFPADKADEVPAMFGQFSSSVWPPIVCHFIFLGLVALIVFAGVKKGIEKFSTITIPVLFVLIVAIVVYSLTLPGSGEGVKYLVKPDFSKLDGAAFAAALGQSFFSISLGVGTMLTYSSYVSDDEDLMASGTGVVFSDVLFALLAGFAIMPAVFAAGIEPSSGPGLLFETLPYIFAKMGAGSGLLSGIIAIVFFLTILVAALTSAISMMEVGVAYLVEEKNFTRGKATLLIFCGTFLLGIVCSLSFGPLSHVVILGNNIFGFLDMVTSNLLLTLGGLMFSIFVGWKMDRVAVERQLTNNGTKPFNAKIFPVVYFLIKYIAPVGILIVIASGLL